MTHPNNGAWYLGCTLCACVLDQIGAGPPYLLVGYSWGGSLVRYIAGLHPEEVVLTWTIREIRSLFDGGGTGM